MRPPLLRPSLSCRCRRRPARGGDRGRAGRRRRRRSAADDFFIGVQRDPGANLSDFDVARFFNKARCDCDETVFVYVALTNGRLRQAHIASIGTGNIEFWIGSDCAQASSIATSAASASPARRCSLFLNDGRATMETDARDAQHVHGCRRRRRRRRHDTGGTLHAQSDLYVSEGIQSYSQTIFVLLEQQRRERRSPRPRSQSLHRPHAAAPAGPAAAHRRSGGQQAVIINWPGVDSADITDLLGYQVLCNRGGRAAGVLRRNVRARLPDLLQEPTTPSPACWGWTRTSSARRCWRRRRVRSGSRSCRTTSPTAWRSSPIDEAATPASPGHPLRDADQDQELLRRLPRTDADRESRVGAGHRRLLHAGARATPRRGAAAGLAGAGARAAAVVIARRRRAPVSSARSCVLAVLAGAVAAAAERHARRRFDEPLSRSGSQATPSPRSRPLQVAAALRVRAPLRPLPARRRRRVRRRPPPVPGLLRNGAAAADRRSRSTTSSSTASARSRSASARLLLGSATSARRQRQVASRATTCRR